MQTRVYAVDLAGVGEQLDSREFGPSGCLCWLHSSLWHREA
jgi:hypothetical protein